MKNKIKEIFISNGFPVRHIKDPSSEGEYTVYFICDCGCKRERIASVSRKSESEINVFVPGFGSGVLSSQA